VLLRELLFGKLYSVGTVSKSRGRGREGPNVADTSHASPRARGRGTARMEANEGAVHASASVRATAEVATGKVIRVPLLLDNGTIKRRIASQCLAIPRTANRFTHYTRARGSSRG